MKKTVISVIILAIVAYSFTIEEITQEQGVKKSSFTTTLSNSDNAKQLLESKCNICHSIKSSEDAMIAPPFKNIQKKYKRVHGSKQDFIDAVVDFNTEPTKDKALMYGALKKFGVMTKMPYSKDDVTKIADYMYDADFETPNWCGGK